MTGPSRGLQPNERFNSAGPRRELTSNGGRPFRPFIRSLDVEQTPRHNRRWEGNGKHKSRGSLLYRRGDEVIPKAQDVKAAPKPKVQKAKKSLRVNPDINIPSTVSVGNFARLLNVSLGRLQKVMANAGMEEQSSYDHVLTAEYASLIAMEFGRNPIVNDEAAFDIYPPPTHPNPSTLPLRPPIVTIMGHVDHGKTTLLDKLRSTSVAKGEAGGITQHIGAFSVPVPTSSSEAPKTITFLDTPGHAAFSAMRARGASVTDIVVLVVAADDGIMPQTREVLDLIEREKLSAVIAINKIDKPGVDIENTQNALLAEGVQLEAFGGDIPCVPVSGLTGKGLDDLVETISLIAETQELRAEGEGDIQGYVLESKIRKGLGPVATVLLLRGCLQPGAHVICGTHHGKVRSMLDSSDKPVGAAYPGMAVTVTGWKSLPNAGDEVLQGTEANVKKAIVNRERKADLLESMEDLEAINEQRRLERDRRETEAEASSESTNQCRVEEQGPKELRLVIKGDVSGSVEAVVDALQCIGNKEACVKVVSSGVGDVTESDVFRAQVAQGAIVAFTVSAPRSVEVLAKQHSVPIVSSKVIYSLIDDIRSRVIELLPSIIETKVTGEANVLQLFDIQLKSKQTMKVAGCRVANGIVEKSKHVRVVRNRETIFEGRLDTFKHHRKDITEAGKGLECGLSIDGFDGLEVGDLIQAFEKIEKPGIL